MAMRVKKNARKGVSGDCNRHHSHKMQRVPVIGKPIPVNRKPSVPFAAMRNETVQSILSSAPSVSTVIAANPLSVAFAVQWQDEEQDAGEAAITERPQPTLATDCGHDVRDDSDRYQAWLKDWAWTPKSCAKSVVSLLHPDEEKEFLPVLRHETVTVHGIPIGNLRRKTLEYQWIPKSWHRVKEQHLKRSANSRQERINNVHHTEVTSAIRKAEFIRTVEMQKRHHDRKVVETKPTPALVVDTPPWSAANSSVYQETQQQEQLAALRLKVAGPPTTREAGPAVSAQEYHGFMEEVARQRVERQQHLREIHYATKHGFMEQVHYLRMARQQRLRMEHFYKSSAFYSNEGQVTGFMGDVGDRMYGRHLYRKRLKFVRAKLRRKAFRAERRKQQEKENRLLGKMQYRSRQWEMYFLKQHGESASDIKVIRGVTEEQASALEAFAAMYPAHLNRDFWNKEPEAEHPDLNRTVTSAQIIQRAEVRVRREQAEHEAMLASTLSQDHSAALRSWFRGHEARKESKFDSMMRTQVIHKVADPAQKRVVSEMRQRSRRRVREERASAVAQALVVSHQRDQEDPHVQHVDLAECHQQFSKLIRAGQADRKRVHTHRLILDKAVGELNMQFSEDHGLILPARLFDGSPIVTSPAMH